MYEAMAGLATPQSPLVAGLPADEPAPDPVPPPFIPSEGVAPWLREILLDLHQRLRNAGY